MTSLLLAVLALAALDGGAPPVDTLTVDLLPGRGEARVAIAPADGGDERSRSYVSGADVSSFRIEPGNSYLFPSSLWDRFSGSRRGAFRIEVTTRADEAVLASGHLVEETPQAGGERMRSVFVGEAAERGLGLYVIARPRQPDGSFPPPPPWVETFLGPLLARLEARFGPLPGAPPRVVVLDFPRRMAKAFPGALVLDRQLALSDGAPPAGRVAVLAHEAAHLWWANAVRTTGAGGSALQEGLAEYGACAVVGDIFGATAEAARWSALRDEYLLSSEAAADAGAALSSESGRTWPGRGVRYARSAWVIRMLEVRVGEDAFAAALRSLVQEGVAVDWAALVSELAAVSGIDLTSFELAWIAGTGHPDPHVVEAASAAGWFIENGGRGGGEFAVEHVCPGQPPRRQWLAVPPGGQVGVPREAADCTLQIVLDDLFLLGTGGPAAPAGLVLGRAWGYPVVQGVEPLSAAERAGLETGDLIVAADSQPLNEDDVRELLGHLTSGRAVRLRLRRGHEKIDTVFRPAGAADPDA